MDITKYLTLLALLVFSSTALAQTSGPYGSDGGRIPRDAIQLGGEGPNGKFDAVKTDGAGSVQTTAAGGSGAVTIADGADVATGDKDDAVVAAGAVGTVSAKLRRLTSDLDDVKTNTAAASAFTTLQLPSAITATLVKAADTSRKRIVIRNLDSAITIYVGGAAVTILTGMQVKAGESISVYSTAAVYSVSASGTPTLAYLDETD